MSFGVVAFAASGAKMIAVASKATRKRLVMIVPVALNTLDKRPQTRAIWIESNFQAGNVWKSLNLGRSGKRGNVA